MTSTGLAYLQGNFAPVLEEVTALDLEVTGTIPEGLDGRLIRNGPNPQGEVDPATYHWFTGVGMVHGLRLRDGRAEWYRNRWVTNPDRFWPNTNVIGHAGRTWALVESGTLPVELTEELDPIGPNGFDGTLEEGYTAHPKRHPGTGELHAVSYLWAWDHVRYTIVGTDARVRREVHVRCRAGRWCTTAPSPSATCCSSTCPARSRWTRPWPGPSCPTAGIPSTAPGWGCCPWRVTPTT